METQEFAKAKNLKFNDEIEYAQNGIVSKMVLKKKTGNVTLFAFDKGQELSAHSAPFDALVQIIEGKSIIVIDGIEHLISSGESIVMPSDIPHAVIAIERFKMILTMIKSE